MFVALQKIVRILTKFFASRGTHYFAAAVAFRPANAFRKFFVKVRRRLSRQYAIRQEIQVFFTKVGVLVALYDAIDNVVVLRARRQHRLGRHGSPGARPVHYAGRALGHGVLRAHRNEPLVFAIVVDTTREARSSYLAYPQIMLRKTLSVASSPSSDILLFRNANLFKKNGVVLRHFGNSPGMRLPQCSQWNAS